MINMGWAVLFSNYFTVGWHYYRSTFRDIPSKWQSASRRAHRRDAPEDDVDHYFYCRLLKQWLNVSVSGGVWFHKWRHSDASGNRSETRIIKQTNLLQRFSPYYHEGFAPSHFGNSYFAVALLKPAANSNFRGLWSVIRFPRGGGT